jgi:hypothetical protein
VALGLAYLSRTRQPGEAVLDQALAWSIVPLGSSMIVQVLSMPFFWIVEQVGPNAPLPRFAVVLLFCSVLYVCGAIGLLPRALRKFVGPHPDPAG